MGTQWRFNHQCTSTRTIVASGQKNPNNCEHSEVRSTYTPAMQPSRVRQSKSVHPCTLAELADTLAIAWYAEELGGILLYFILTTLTIVGKFGCLLLTNESINLFFRPINVNYQKSVTIITAALDTTQRVEVIAFYEFACNLLNQMPNLAIVRNFQGMN